MVSRLRGTSKPGPAPKNKCAGVVKRKLFAYSPSKVKSALDAIDTGMSMSGASKKSTCGSSYDNDEASGKVKKWIQCDICLKNFHVQKCVPKSYFSLCDLNASDLQNSEVRFECHICANYEDI